MAQPFGAIDVIPEDPQPLLGETVAAVVTEVPAVAPEAVIAIAAPPANTAVTPTANTAVTPTANAAVTPTANTAVTPTATAAHQITTTNIIGYIVNVRQSVLKSYEYGIVVRNSLIINNITLPTGCISSAAKQWLMNTVQKCAEMSYDAMGCFTGNPHASVSCASTKDNTYVDIGDSVNLTDLQSQIFMVFMNTVNNRITAGKHIINAAAIADLSTYLDKLPVMPVVMTPRNAQAMGVRGASVSPDGATATTTMSTPPTLQNTLQLSTKYDSAKKNRKGPSKPELEEILKCMNTHITKMSIQFPEDYRTKFPNFAGDGDKHRKRIANYINNVYGNKTRYKYADLLPVIQQLAQI